ncbi:hypothetical protein [Rhodopila globiformis]|uniref:Uncharacterized protein n=1 Tax=Rhodopila globiformis TaxID=1071 RepID=A0A2S6NKF9_RHOGL|nr:hypothetical protein [Rhodopila globiformis]PPQ35365.1 hypothetical protein CCS01_07720 [Rhodopila globiformis]
MTRLAPDHIHLRSLDREATARCKDKAGAQVVKSPRPMDRRVSILVSGGQKMFIAKALLHSKMVKRRRLAGGGRYFRVV